MIIDCISDLHGYKPKLEGGDLLILAGDYTAAGKLTQWHEFFHWLKEQPYNKKILIAGNHDHFFETGFPKNKEEADDLKEVIDFLDIDGDFEYLCDSGTEYKGLKIWGSPWSLTFPEINPKCTAFTGTEEELAEKWELIPYDTHILITHGPSKLMHDETIDGLNVGSPSLLKWTAIHCNTIKLHVHGHIHEAYGVWDQRKIQKQFNGKEGPVFVNCSYVNEYYQPVNNPVRVIL